MKKKLHAAIQRHPFIFLLVLILFLAGIEGSFSFCSKKPCPGFSDPFFDQWFPYQPGTSCYFKSNSGQTDTLNINSLYKSDPSTTGGGFESGSCSTSADIESKDSTTSRPLALSVQYSVSSDFKHLSIRLNSFYAQASDLGDSGLVTTPFSSVNASYLSSLQINGRTYYKVQILQTDTTESSPDIYKIWLSSGNGIIAYEKRNGLQQFVKQ